jgi:hypothetical protein
MESIFLGFAFRPPDRELADNIERLVDSHGLHVITGEDLEGRDLTDEVKDHIKRADATIALLTCRNTTDAVDGTHSWVRDELHHAWSLNKPAIGIVEAGVKLTGMYADRENIPFNAAAPAQWLLRLSVTIGAWKIRAGRPLLVRVEPQEAAELATRENGASCYVRVLNPGVVRRDWERVQPWPEPGGTFLHVTNVRPEDRVQVKVQYGESIWLSVYEPQWLRITLKRQGSQ